MNIPKVPQLPEQFVCEAPAFVLDYIRDVMAWGNMGWNRAQEKEARVAELESGIKATLAEIESGCYADAHSTLSSL